MKKITQIMAIALVLSLSFQGLNAQIKIAANGKVGFKTITPEWGTIEINKDGKHDGICIYEPLKKGSTFRMFRDSNYGYLTRGGDLDRGIKIADDGRTTISTSSTLGSTRVLTLYCKYMSNTSLEVKAGEKVVYQLRSDGRVYAKEYNVMSDVNLKENILGLENSLSSVMKLKGVSYDLKEKVTKPVVEEAVNQELGKNEPRNSIVEEKQDPVFEKQMIEDANKRKIGLLAQEVELIYPELVNIGLNGNKSVNYIGLIPVLIEALKEQQKQLVDQQQQIVTQEENLAELISSIADKNTTGITSIQKGNASLKQNRPNPFNEQTAIGFYLPETVSKAMLNIFDLTGKQVKSFEVVQRLEGEVTVFANELQPGMYTYALIADGRIVDTRSMIITD